MAGDHTLVEEVASRMAFDAIGMTGEVVGDLEAAGLDRFRYLEVVGVVARAANIDQVPGIIAFTRCGEVHHNLAIQTAPVAFPHHIAFEVDDIDDVVRGGQHMVDIDPDRNMWGVGRHAIGSNWFWYLRDPSGTFVEYTADIDRISAQDRYRPKDWQGHEFLYSFGPPVPAEFLEPADMADLIAASA